MRSVAHDDSRPGSNPWAGNAPGSSLLDSEFMSEATNSLGRASSAYLRSAMHQPIQWHEWGEKRSPPRNARTNRFCWTLAQYGAIGAT